MTMVQSSHRLSHGLLSAGAILGLSLALLGCGGSGSKQGVKTPPSPRTSAPALSTTTGSKASHAGTDNSSGKSPTDCPQTTYAPAGQYQLAVTGTLSGSLILTHPAKGEGNSYTNDITGKLCTALKVSTLSGVVTPANVVFNPAKFTALGTLHFTMQIYPYGDSYTQVLKSTLSTGAAANGGINLNLQSTVMTHLVINEGQGDYIRCADGPVSIDFTTAAPGGQPMTGPLTNSTATLVASGFTVPPVTNISGCSLKPPGGFGYLVNLGAKLPNDHTFSKLVVHISVKGDE